MKSLISTFVLFAAALPGLAQTPAGKPDSPIAEAAAAKAHRQTFSDAGKAALQKSKDLATAVRGLHGPERVKALEVAATAYDGVVAAFAQEPAVAAVAAINGADLWRQQGSLPLAEKDYLLAAQLDAPRYAQRGLLGAADMQRRQKRVDEAMATYAKVVTVDGGSSRAQDARLWQARLLQTMERIDEAIAAFQGALETADPGRETIEAANFLALAWVEKGDLDAAGRAVEHAEQAVATMGEEDPIVVERLKKALETMSAKKALQRARDKANGAAGDAIRLEAARGK
jgi:tetratricopeptide (TPR) repeat protein